MATIIITEIRTKTIEVLGEKEYYEDIEEYNGAKTIEEIAEIERKNALTQDYFDDTTTSVINVHIIK